MIRSARGQERWFYLLASPWLIGLVLLQAGPALAAALLSFFRWEPPLPPRFVGMDNLAGLATDARFLHAALNTAVYAIATVGPGLALGLGLALLLRRIGRGGNAMRAAVFLPAVVAGVATALMWGWILNPRFGLIDGLLGLVGLDGPAWLRDPAWAMTAMILMGLWNVGVDVVVFLAALATVPTHLHEAAALDGAGRFARFRHVTWPALMPVTFSLAIVNVIAASQVFTPMYVLTRGGPDDATLTTALYAYQTAFGRGDLGYASAITFVVLCVVLVLVTTQMRVLGPRVLYAGAEE